MESFASRLRALQEEKGSVLCVGLDPDKARIPTAFQKTGGLCEWGVDMVDRTLPYAPIYKANIAFYAAHSAEDQLESLIAYIQNQGAMVILDAKRGDIGNTAKEYAAEAFVRYDADAVTLNPFMGYDSVAPYEEYEGKGLIILCRTSNPGAAEFQNLRIIGGDMLYEKIAKGVLSWDKGCGSGKYSLVVGATAPAELANVRRIVGNMPILIPGIGAQGGEVKAIVKAGNDGEGYGMIINSSRAIIYAPDPTAAARETVELINRYR